MIETHLKIYGKDFGFFGVTADYTPAELGSLLSPLIFRLRQNSLHEQPTVAPEVSGTSLVDELTKLATLKESGLLSDAEFVDAKAKLIQGI